LNRLFTTRDPLLINPILKGVADMKLATKRAVIKFSLFIALTLVGIMTVGVMQQILFAI
jgi:hypothetical protein